MKIQELCEGYKGELTVLLSSVNKGVTAKGAPYLSFSIQDKTGSMEAKFWGVKEEELDVYQPGMLVTIHGDVLSHKNQLQYRINSAKLENLDEVDIYEFVKSSAQNSTELKQQIEAFVAKIENEAIHTIVASFVTEYEKDFYEYPAATKNHHDYVGGLATHVLGMLKLAASIADLYPSLHRDLLYGGVILHDIGKLIELNKAIVAEYTREGKLLGHISIMQAMVYERAHELKIEGEEVLLLRHMILSHHGEYAYGSPVLPMIPEAEILHLIDNIDARMSTLDKALASVTPGEFSPRIFAMENRNFYKPMLGKEVE